MLVLVLSNVSVFKNCSCVVKIIGLCVSVDLVRTSFEGSKSNSANVLHI